MSKKLTNNGRWESSRMMLPEHVNALNELRREGKRRVKPNVDFDQAEEIAEAVGRSYSEKVEITIKLYDPFNDREEIGVVDRVDQQGRRIRIADEWVKFDDIIAVQ